ncbi:MAG: hypothetical protein KH138_13065 [Firmicutes bacterium]|nr:hypothetical protein [Bacillota bacterium]
MDTNLIVEAYLQITQGNMKTEYVGPEEQGKSIVKCSILEETNLEYNNSTMMMSPSK